MPALQGLSTAEPEGKDQPGGGGTCLVTPVDVLVIGAGAAGISAAQAAAAQGLAVTLVDENPRQALRIDGVAMHSEHVVWSVAPGFRIDALGPQGARVWTAKALIVATGARERFLPFPGWTLPGVTGLRAAGLEAPSGAQSSGRLLLVAGRGPWLAEAAIGALEAGDQILAVIDSARPADWAAMASRVVWQPARLLRGLGQILRLKAAGVPILSGFGIAGVTSEPEGLVVTAAPCDGAGRLIEGPRARSFTVDRLAAGFGAAPNTEVTRLLRAAHHFDREAGGWRPILDPDGRGSQAGLYVAGDAAGLDGAASLSGRLAGLAAARDLDRIDQTAFASLAQPLRQSLARACSIGRALGRLAAPRPAEIAAIAPTTIVCPCEDLSRADIDAAAAEGAASLNQIKAGTRCGMGICQGRICSDIVTDLLAARGIKPESSGFWTGRTPLRPLRLDRLVGDYDYADIVLPPAAPL